MYEAYTRLVANDGGIYSVESDAFTIHKMTQQEWKETRTIS